MCKVCEAMPLNQLYVSPYPRPKDVYDDLTPKQIADLTRDAIAGIMAYSRMLDEAERLKTSGQTRLF